jgi:hypothetical protein
MAFVISVRTDYNNFRSTIFSSMVKQKLGLTFNQGFLLGLLVMFLFCTAIVGKFFVSKEVFKLNQIYIDGNIYKLCRIR